MAEINGPSKSEGEVACWNRSAADRMANKAVGRRGRIIKIWLICISSLMTAISTILMIRDLFH